MTEYISIDEGRVILRRKVAQAGGPAAFVARHTHLDARKIEEWIGEKGGMPSHQAFRAAGLEVHQVLKVKG